MYSVVPQFEYRLRYPLSYLPLSALLLLSASDLFALSPHDITTCIYTTCTTSDPPSVSIVGGNYCLALSSTIIP